MDRKLTVAFFALTCCVSAQQILGPILYAPSATLSLGPFDAMLDMVGSAPATTATAAIMDAGMLGHISSPSQWGFAFNNSPVTSTPAITVGAAQAGCALPGNLTVSAARILKSHTSQSLAVDASGPYNYATYTLNPGVGINHLTAVGCITLTVPNVAPLGNDYDLIRFDLDTGVAAVIQLNNGNCGTNTYGIRMHDPTHFPACVAIPGGPGSSFYYVMSVDESTGFCRTDLWQSGVYLGNVNFTAVDFGHNIQYVRIGNVETGADGGTIYFSNTALSYTNYGTYSAIASYSTAIQQVQTSSTITTTSGTTVATTPDGPTTAGNCLWGLAVWGSTSQTGSVSDTVNGAWTAIDSPVNALGAYRIQSFFRCGIAAGTPTATLTNSGTNTTRVLTLHEVKGITTLDLHPAANTGTSATMTSASVTTVQASSYLTGGCILSNTLTAAGAGWNVSREWKLSGLADQSQIAGPGTYTLSNTQSASGAFGCLVDTFH